MLRCSVRSSGGEEPTAKTSLVASTWPSDEPIDAFSDHGVGSYGAKGFTLARLCLVWTWPSDRPRVSSLRPSDHPVLLSLLLFLCKSSDATRKGIKLTPVVALCTKFSDSCFYGTIGSFDGGFSFDLLFSLFSIWHVVFLHPWDLEMSTKTC
jgi:hypothetical protein